MVDKHKLHMQHLCSQGHRGTGSWRCCTTSQVCGHDARAAPCSVLHTGEHSKSDSCDPSLRPGDVFLAAPFARRVCIANAAHARCQTGTRVSVARWKALSPSDGLNGYAQQRNMIEQGTLAVVCVGKECSGEAKSDR